MNLRILVLQSILWLKYTTADDVGQQYDPKNENSWELDFGSYPYQSFHSVDVISPALRKAADSPECHDDNYIFLSPRGHRVSHPGLAILDNQGEAVWVHYVHGQPYNLKVQEYQGEKVFTFWVGDDAVGGHGEGDWYIYNSKYEEVAKISGADGLRTDLHELTITPQGTALMTVYQAYPVRQPGIFKLTDTVWIWDCLFQEVDIATKKLVFQWRASDHHSLNETYRPPGRDGVTNEHPWDWYHINSIQKDELGNYLISARATSTITYINGTSGNIIWVLGGKRNAFKDLSDGRATNMAYQHLARLHNLTDFPILLANEIEAHGQKKDKAGVTKQLITAFDNAADDRVAGDRPSRGVLIELTYPTEAGAQGSSDVPLTARLIRSYDHPTRVIAASQGSMQLIPSHNGSDPKVMLGYGYVGMWTEFSADGKVLCDNRFSTMNSWGRGHVQSFKALKAPWVGEPTWPPVAALGFGNSASVFVSWNGATEVQSWKLQKSEKEVELSDEDWTDVAISAKTGFETKIEYDASDAKLLRLIALDKDGNILGISANIHLGWITVLHQAMESIARNPLKTALGFLCLLTLAVLFLRLFRTWRARAFLGYEKLGQDRDALKHA